MVGINRAINLCGATRIGQLHPLAAKPWEGRETSAERVSRGAVIAVFCSGFVLDSPPRTSLRLFDPPLSNFVWGG